ncbi:MAG: NADPH-dependent F420 reductase [Cenarchaeum symbiont of Oopsacas minuta]|nr:NADPH-dependent F420 reductase [Cenarchaeum symbiont of Oopsacas minuta]
MKIGIIGGTGGMGKGFATRWCKENNILIGSRDADRAITSAKEYEDGAKKAYGTINGSISGHSNDDVAEQSDVLVLSIPYENIDTICPSLFSKTREECIVISPIVPMTKTDVGFEFIPLKEDKKFAHQMVASHMKNPALLVSAFHVISEKKLADPNRDLDYDIFVCGDDANAVKTVNTLISQINGLRALYLGSSTLAYMAEMATPLLLNVMIKNKLKNPGIKIV